jgi:hypothetical protein
MQYHIVVLQFPAVPIGEYITGYSNKNKEKLKNTNFYGDIPKLLDFRE